MKPYYEIQVQHLIGARRCKVMFHGYWEAYIRPKHYMNFGDIKYALDLVLHSVEYYDLKKMEMMRKEGKR